MCGLDEESGVVIVTPTTDATVDQLARAVARGAAYSVSSSQTVLFQAAPDRFVTLTKLCIAGNEFVFYASWASAAPTGSPRALGLDRGSFVKLQKAASRLAGWKIN